MKKLIFACIGIFLFACNNNLQEEVAISEKSKARVVSQKQPDKVADAIDFLNEAFVDDTMSSAVPYYHASDAQFCQTKTKSRF